MYASPYSPRRAQPATASAMSGLYKAVGIETGVNSASPHQLVTLLFDSAVESMSLARTAMREGQIETKVHAIAKALRIIDEGLKANLNFESGGELAANLGDLYGYISIRLTLANLRNDESIIEECLKLIEPVRQAWAAIAPQTTAPARVGVAA